jgi:hypothetical protein
LKVKVNKLTVAGGNLALPGVNNAHPLVNFFENRVSLTSSVPQNVRTDVTCRALKAANLEFRTLQGVPASEVPSAYLLNNANVDQTVSAVKTFSSKSTLLCFS